MIIMKELLRETPLLDYKSQNIQEIPSEFLEKELSFPINSDIAEQINHNATIVNFATGEIVLREGEESSCVYHPSLRFVSGCYKNKFF